MTSIKSNLVYVRLVYPEIPKDLKLKNKSWLLSGISTYKELEIFCFGAPELKKHESLGRIFQHLEPINTNNYQMELGVTLPDLLSNMEGNSEYSIKVRLENESKINLNVSNQMAKLNYKIKNDHYHAILPRNKIETVLKKNDLQIPKESHVKLLKTCVTSRFLIKGSDAEDALEKNIEKNIYIFLEALNKLALTNLMLEKGYPSVFTPVYDRGTFDTIYMIVGGRKKNIFGHGKIALNMGKIILNPEDLNKEQTSKVKAYLSGKEQIDDIIKLVSTARSYLEGGLLEYALLQMVIAAEIATTRFVHSMLILKGVSKTKLQDFETDITLSQMLNIYIYALCPKEKKPDRNLIGKINRLRDLRNDIMHRGTFSENKDSLLELYDATKEYIEFLKNVNNAS